MDDLENLPLAALGNALSNQTENTELQGGFTLQEQKIQMARRFGPADKTKLR